MDTLQPDGTIYVGRNPEGMRMYLKQGDPGHMEQVAQIRSVSNAPAPAGLHPAQGQGITTHTAQTIKPSASQPNPYCWLYSGATTTTGGAL